MRSGERRLHSLEKIVVVGALAAVLFVSIGFAQAGDGPKLRSAVALVQDVESGETLYEKNSDTILPIASITKLMTAIVVLERGLDLDSRVAVSAQTCARCAAHACPGGCARARCSRGTSCCCSR
jgi:D-alanyl-D-alanine carboxypeptidase